MTKNLKLLSLAALALGGLGAAPAMAQNLNFANGDLILGFQSKAGTGSDTNVMVNLGNTATVFRNANTNSINLDNIVNVNAILVATFGASWWDNTNLLWGAAGSWANVIEGSLQNGDPEQSIYMTKSRTSVGANEEIAVSSINTPSASNQTNAANNINTLNNKFESQPGNPSQVALLNTEAGTWEDFTPTSGAFVQSNAFTAYTSGIQQRFGAASYGTSNATGSPVAIEGALDLYRAQGQNNVSGQFGEGATPLRAGVFQGFLTIDTAGNVDFITAVVPEPSSALLIGAASILGLGFRRRRTATA